MHWLALRRSASPVAEVPTPVCVCTSGDSWKYVRIYIQMDTDVHKYIHIHTYIVDICIHSNICTYVRTYVRK